jgi:hypothetical protein
MNGNKDSSVFNDTNKVYGLDLPVFTATYGINFVKGDDFSLDKSLQIIRNNIIKGQPATRHVSAAHVE